MPASHKSIPEDWHIGRKYSILLLSKQYFGLEQKRSPRPPSPAAESCSMQATQLFENRKAIPSASSGCIKGPAVDVLDEDELDEDDDDDDEDDDEEDRAPSDSEEGSTLQVRAQSKTASCSEMDGKGALVDCVCGATDDVEEEDEDDEEDDDDASKLPRT